MTQEVEEYFFDRYRSCPVGVVPGLWPDFESKYRVDDWLEAMGCVPKAYNSVLNRDVYAGMSQLVVCRY